MIGRLESADSPRDISHFLAMRDYAPADAHAVSGLLVSAFTQTYARKLLDVRTDADRVLELIDASARHNCGAVRILELGHEVIGTYSLVRPGTSENQAWHEDAASLRCLALDAKLHGLGLSSTLLADAIALAGRWSVPRICLHVQHGADGVARLYTRAGFERDRAGDTISCGNRIEGYTLTMSPR